MFFDFNPLDNPDAFWQHGLLALVAGFIGFMIGYIARRQQAEALEGQLTKLEIEVDDCLNTRTTKSPPARKATPPVVATPVPAVTPNEPAVAVLSAPVARDNLKIVEGIGPKIEELLNQGGILTFSQLADASPERLRQILVAAGPRFQIQDPGTWPRQAQLAAGGQLDELKILQNQLTAGRA